MTVVVGTAGHIDHGKTSLLRALTGIDADRLPEERARGMTIDVGYAHLELPDGSLLDFVDVPGHDRLVGNMLVGAGEVDACLLVVAVDDGPRAQTLEHLELVHALGIRHAVVVLTKIDLADRERVDEVRGLVEALLARTRLAGSPIVETSTVSGAGLESLRSALVGLRDRVRVEDGGRLATLTRLPIDRVFSVRGRGVVVTGTLQGRGPRVGDELVLLPSGRAVRIRDLQVHGRPVTCAPDHGRVALNLRGVTPDELARGQVLVGRPPDGDATSLTAIGVPVPTDRLLVLLERPAALRPGTGEPSWPPSDRTSVRLHLGTDQVDVRLVRSGGRGLEFDDRRASAMLRLARPTAAAIGDRFVLRLPPPAGLLAGGVVLDPDPPRGISRRRSTGDRLARLASATLAGDAEAVMAATLEHHGLLVAAGGPCLATDVEAAASRAAIDALADHHVRDPGGPGLPAAALRPVISGAIGRLASLPRPLSALVVEGVLDRAAGAGIIVREAGRVRLASHRPSGPDPRLLEAMTRLEAALDVPMPPALPVAAAAAGCPPEGVRELERSGRIVVLDDGVAWTSRVHARFVALSCALAERGPLTPAALRDASGTSRRYVLALLEDLSRRGLLRRTPEGHVPGPRAGLVARDRARDRPDRG